MDGLPDPNTPSRPPLVVDGPGHTRPALPNSPSNIQNRSKRNRIAQTQVPPIKITGLNPSARQHGVANAIMASSLDEMVRTALMRKSVTMKLATVLDDYVASYSGDHNKEARAIAKELVSTIAIHLRTHHFAATGGDEVLPIGQPLSTQTSGASQKPSKSEGARLHSSNPTSYSAVLAANLNGSTSSGVLKRPAAPRPTKPANSATTVSNREDLRVLCTLHQDPTVTIPRQDPFHLRAAICKALNLQLADVPKVTLTQTGFAIHPANKSVRDKLISEENKTLIQRACVVDKVALPEKWYTYALTDVPYTFTNLTPDLRTVDTDKLLVEECRAQTGLEPIEYKRSIHGPNPVTGRGTFIISFLAPVRRFQLFGTGGFSRLIEKSPKVQRHSNGCQGYCNQRACTRAPRCQRCGDRLDNHSPGELATCTRPCRCANCYGPYEAGHDNCPAAPKVVKKRITPLTKSELAKVRKIGLQAFQKANKRPTQTTNEEAMEEDTDAALLRQQLNEEAPSTLREAAANKRSLSGTRITRGRPDNTPSTSSTSDNSSSSGASIEDPEVVALPVATRLPRSASTKRKNYNTTTVGGYNKAAGIDSTPTQSQW
jgi:hypothetical protein